MADEVGSAPARETGADSSHEPLGRFGRNKLGILLTLFFVAGILGLPLLLLSPVFSRPEKVFWTIAVLIYTAIIFSLFALFLVWAWNQVSP